MGKRRRSSAPDPAEAKARLASARFRMLNEQLYTTSAADARTAMAAEPRLWYDYHDGYKLAVGGWPSRPLDACMKWLKQSVLVEKKRELVIGDFGCGEAELGKRCQEMYPGLTMHSFDLVALDDTVVPCSITNVPLEDESLDVTVFCLSLMGTDYGDCIVEARRVMKDGGRMFVAEVRSRFGEAVSEEEEREDNDEKPLRNNNKGRKQKGSTSHTNIRPFVKAMHQAGFAIVPAECDLNSNTHFVVMTFRLKKKKGAPRDKLKWPVLKACTYKKR